MGRRGRASRLLLAGALALSLTTAVSCGKKEEPPPPQTGRAAGVVSGSERFVGLLDRGLAQFGADVASLENGPWLGEMIRTGALSSKREVLADLTASVQFDIVCVLDAKGETTLLRVSNPLADGGTEFADLAGTSEAGPCVNMQSLIKRALGTLAPVTSFELYPPELLRYERVMKFREGSLADVIPGTDPTADLAGQSLAKLVAIPLKGPGATPGEVEPRALMMSDVRPVIDKAGAVQGVLVTAWLVSRVNELPTVFDNREAGEVRMNASLYVENTRASTGLVDDRNELRVGDRLDPDTYNTIRSEGELYMTRTDLGYGPVDVIFTSIVDGTGRAIGCTSVEAPCQTGAPTAPSE